MQKSIYPTWYEFKEDLQEELGRSMLNQEWLHIKPEEPLPWNNSCFRVVLLKLLDPKQQVIKTLQGWMGIMTTETNERNYFRTAKAYAKMVTNHFNQRRIWIRCPRCIGGNMYHEDNGEYVCMQCGCSYDPDKGTQTPNVGGIL